MRSATLNRSVSDKYGTFGSFITDSGLTLCSGELPWQGNMPGKSCVLPGTYVVAWALSPKWGECYHVLDVPNRSGIEIHPANWMGNADMSFMCDLEGCIAVGEKIGVLSGQKALLASRDALSALEADLNQEPFQLIIVRGS